MADVLVICRFVARTGTEVQILWTRSMFGLASQHIDGTCGLIILRVRVKKESGPAKGSVIRRPASSLYNAR